MSANTDNYIVVQQETGEILCTGFSANVESRPIIIESEDNKTIMILSLQEDQTFNGDEDLNHYFDSETNQTVPKKKMELMTSHPFVVPQQKTVVLDNGEEVLSTTHKNRIDVDVNTNVVISNIPPEVKEVKIFEGHANKETIKPISLSKIELTKESEEIVLCIFSSPKHEDEYISIRFIEENSPYGIYGIDND